MNFSNESHRETFVSNEDQKAKEFELARCSKLAKVERAGRIWQSQIPQRENRNRLEGVIPNSFAESGRERDRTMRLHRRGGRRDDQRLHCALTFEVPAASEQSHGFRKVASHALLRSAASG